jgi:hypothetical protein
MKRRTQAHYERKDLIAFYKDRPELLQYALLGEDELEQRIQKARRDLSARVTAKYEGREREAAA